MELEEMKSIWSDLSDQLEKQKKLSNKTILKMTQEQYNHRINKIIYPEKIGAVVCFLAAGYILFNIEKLDTLPTLVFGIVTTAILVLLPILSLKTMKSMSKNINIAENSYKQTLGEFANIKKKFINYKKFSYVLGLGMVIVLLPPFAKIAKGIDVFSDISFWYKVPFGMLIVSVFVYYVMRAYSRNLNDIDKLIQELESED